MMSHRSELADQDIEELAEELWTLAEEGGARLEALRQAGHVEGLDDVLRAMQERGLLRREGDSLQLTEPGRTLAERQVRRHRLAETLFTTVLEVRDDASVNRTACVIEHVLDPGLTDSICAFLGHPRRCPHGKPIPPGACCRTLSAPVEPLVQPLSRLPVGCDARIVYIAPREAARLVRLSNLGIVPGAVIQLQQVKPAAVLRVGETTLAVEPEVAGEIYVRRAV